MLRKISRRNQVIAAATLGALSLLSGSSAMAETWTGGTSTDFNDASNWSPATVPNSTVAAADFNTKDITGTEAVNVTSGVILNNLTFGDAAGADGTYSLTGSDITLGGTTPTITVNSGLSGAVTIGNVLTGTSGLKLTGAGSLTLTAANTYSGGTTVDSGTLTINSGATLGSGGLSFTNAASTAFINLNASQSITSLSAVNSGASTNILTLASGTTLSLNQNSNTTFGAKLAGSGAISKTGSGTLTLNQINTYTGTITLNGGGLVLDMSPNPPFTATSNISLPSGARIAVGGSTLNYKIGTLNAVVQTTNLTVNAGHSSFSSTRGSGGRIVATFGGTPIRNIGGTVDIANLTGSSNDWRAGTGINVNGVTPWMTVTGSNWFVAAGTGTNGSAYSAYTSSTATTLGTATQNVTVVTDVAVPLAATINTLRFNDSANSRTLTIGTGDTLTIGTGAILVTNAVANHRSRIQGGSIAGGNPGSSSGFDLLIHQNLNTSAGSAAEFIIDSAIVDNAGGATALTKSGIGLLRITNTANTYTGRTFLNGGTTRISGDGSLGTVPGSVAADSVTFHGGTLQLAASFDLNSNRGITILQNGATFDTNGFNSNYAGSIAGIGSLTKTGAGVLNLTGASTNTGNVVVSAGTLGVNNSSGSATGSGAVTVASGSTLTGAGTISGAVGTVSGTIITPGNSGIGTLTAGAFTMTSGSILNFELPASGSTSDLINITNSGGFTLNGGGLNLYAEGTTNQFLVSGGSYKLFQYNGSIGGTGISALTSANVLNPQGGLTYTFDTTTNPGFVTLSIGGSVAALSQWANDADGNWSVSSNWTPTTVPQNPGDTAKFTTTLATVGRTVTLDGSKSVGSIQFDSGSTNGYTIAPGSGTLSIDNAGLSSLISVDNLAANPATHTIATPVALVSNTLVSMNNSASNALVLSGDISGPGTLSKSGPGMLVLSGNNSYGPAAGTIGTTISGGTIQVGSSTALSTGDVANTASTTLQGIANVSLANNFKITAGTTTTVDTQANNMTLSGVISQTASSAALIKSGSGTLVLSNDNTYTGSTTINTGTLAIGAGGATGAVGGSITNNGALIINRSGTFNFTNLVSGTGSLTKSGTADTTLTVANTFSGETAVTGGSLILGTANAVQNSTVNYDNQGGTISFGTLTAATFGGLKGAQSLALTNTTPAGVALTIGGNNASVTYSGALSGTGGSLTKIGTGTQILTGANSYTGGTTITSSVLQLDAGGVINGAALGTAANNTARLYVNGGSFTASGSSTLTGISQSGGGASLLMSSGSATFNSLQTTVDGSLIRIDGGTLTATNLNLVRTSNNNTNASLTTGYYQTGGLSNITNLNIGTGNSSASVRVEGGTLNAGTVVLGNQSSANRGGVITVTGGGLNVSDTTNGLVLVKNNSTIVNQAVSANFSGGVNNLGKISFGFDNLVPAGSVVNFNISGSSEVYIGSGGIVKNASDANMTSALNLNGGTLGASADWTGSHPITLLASSTIKAADAASVNHNITLSSDVTGAGDLNKSGGGTLALTGPITYTGATTVNAGKLITNNGIQNGNALNINNGGVTEIPLNGGATSVTSITSLNTVGTGSHIELHDNDLVLNYGAGPSSYGSTVSKVLSGLTLLGGAATDGITSAEVDAQTVAGTILAVVDDGDPNILGGITSVSGYTIPNPAQSVIVKYTWFGDANLDGIVDGSDYALTDTGFTSGGALTGWVFGDYDYNGIVDGGDYALQDTGFIAQTGALPEPTTLGLLGLGAVGMLRRRRRA